MHMGTLDEMATKLQEILASRQLAQAASNITEWVSKLVGEDYFDLYENNLPSWVNALHCERLADYQQGGEVLLAYSAAGKGLIITLRGNNLRSIELALIPQLTRYMVETSE